MAHLLLDFGIMLQVLSTSTKQMMNVINKFWQSHSVDNRW